MSGDDGKRSTGTDEQHHVIAATQTLLYDTNSLDAENTEALIGARRAVALIKELPPLVRILSPLASLCSTGIWVPSPLSRSRRVVGLILETPASLRLGLSASLDLADM
jgi:hypothetical protein